MRLPVGMPVGLHGKRVIPWGPPLRSQDNDSFTDAPKSTEPSKRFANENLTVLTKASEISVFQISISADFSQPQPIIPPPPLSTIGKRNTKAWPPKLPLSVISESVPVVKG